MATTRATTDASAAMQRALLIQVEAPRFAARWRRYMWWSSLLCLLMTVVLCAMSLADTWQGWTSGVWPHDSSEGAAFLVAAPLVLALFLASGRSSPLVVLGTRLHAQMVGVGATMLPVVEAQPAPLRGGEVPTFDEHVGRLRGLQDRRRAVGLRVAGGLLLVCAILVWGIALLPLGSLLTWFPTSNDPLLRAVMLAFVVVFAAGGLVLFWLAALNWRRAGVVSRGLSLIADAQGLRWRDTRYFTGKHALAWSEARAFLTVPSLNTGRRGFSGAVYLLVSEREALLWTLTPHPTPAEALAHERLTRLVASYTRLPLRDVSGALAAFAYTLTGLGATPRLLQTRMLTAADAALPPDALPPDALPPDALAGDYHARVVRLRKRYTVISLVAILCALLLGFGPDAMQFYQARAYGGLLSQAQATPPLFADTMTPLSTIWMLAPTDSPGSAATPTANGYVIGGPAGQTVLALAGPPFARQSIALTADVSQQTPDNGMDTQGGAGLLARSNADQSTQVVFYVLANGDWALARWDASAAHPEGVWSDLLSGSSDIHYGVGAVNTLSIVERGTSDYCYINGDLVGFATNDTAPTSGQVGLFVNDGGYPATFTNFAVYSAG